MTLIASNDRIVCIDDALRLKCLREFKGHHVYYNTEFSGLWCYRCGCVWECDPPVNMKEGE